MCNKQKGHRTRQTRPLSQRLTERKNILYVRNSDRLRVVHAPNARLLVCFCRAASPQALGPGGRPVIGLRAAPTLSVTLWHNPRHATLYVLARPNQWAHAPPCAAGGTPPLGHSAVRRGGHERRGWYTGMCASQLLPRQPRTDADCASQIITKEGHWDTARRAVTRVSDIHCRRRSSYRHRSLARPEDACLCSGDASARLCKPTRVGEREREE
ncbi:hypothetical protein BDW22DRAFT_753815 [Trametopsis cervina]|nr:hypothetical protein BDW22DRAFT_753815 [Trametopsis cervina]